MFKSFLSKQSYWDLFAISFGLVFALIIMIVAWSDVGGSKMWWIIAGSVGAGLLSMGAGAWARDAHKNLGGARPFGY